MLKLFLWLRYLRKKKIVFLSIAAVAVSVSLLIVVASLFSGFINAFEHSIVDAVGDVVIDPPRVISNYDKLIENLDKASCIKGATGTIWGYGLLHVGKGNVRAVQVMGIEPQRRSRVMGFNEFLFSNKYPSFADSNNVTNSPDEIRGYVGIGVLTNPDEETDEYNIEEARKMLGEEVRLTTGTLSGGDSITDFKRQLVRFTISDIVETGFYDFDSQFIYMPVEQLSEIMYPDEELPVVENIQIKLAQDADTEVALAIIRGIWGNYVREYHNSNQSLLSRTVIETSLERQAPIIAAYKQQMNVLLVIFGVVSFGVVILIFCIFSLIVRLKQKDIAVMKSCGTTSCSVAWIFVGFGACVGIVGSGLGMIFGYIITRNINTIEQWIRIIFGLKLWKSSVYLFTKIPNQVNWQAILFTIPIEIRNWQWIINFRVYDMILVAILASAIGAIIPAIIAARTKPVEILRYE
ncbi:MAG: ABC transporter permease [Sedimentisphaerales bacterium]|nr:ABC transporter permease [Sedimentisphaerales bacterium]